MILYKTINSTIKQEINHYIEQSDSYLCICSDKHQGKSYCHLNVCGQPLQKKVSDIRYGLINILWNQINSNNYYIKKVMNDCNIEDES